METTLSSLTLNGYLTLNQLSFNAQVLGRGLIQSSPYVFQDLY